MAAGFFVLPLPLPPNLSQYALIESIPDPLTADLDYLTPGTATSSFEPVKGADDNFVTGAEKSNLHAPGSDNQVIPTALADLSADSTHRLVSDTEKSTWNAKQPAGSYLVASDIADKVDKVTGKGLSTKDYTTADQTKLSGIEAGANNYSHPSNHAASVITQDSSNRFVSDSEKSTWNGKQSIPIQVGSLTLTSGSWSLVSGLYEYVLTNANILSTSIVDIIPDNADISIVQAALIYPKTVSSTGSVKIYSKNVPAANIGVTINIF